MICLSLAIHLRYKAVVCVFEKKYKDNYKISQTKFNQELYNSTHLVTDFIHKDAFFVVSV